MARPLCSMTGFGRGEAPLEGGVLVAEVRSVNSRHLDLRVRLPRELASLEPSLREAAAGYFERGQVEIAVRVPEAAASGEVEIDLDAANRYARAAEQLRGELGQKDPLPIATLMGLPGVARLREPELLSDATRTAARAAVESASRAAREMRAREGEALGAELDQRLLGLVERVGAVESRAQDVKQSLRERLERRLTALAPDVEVDPGRIEQEVVVYVDRMDVTEETVRLRSHVDQFRETLEASGSIGRKLEFLLQEMGREVNTIGSKASDVPITHDVVELKSELEKLREQVLNIE